MKINLKKQGILYLCTVLTGLFCLTFILATRHWYSDWRLIHQSLATPTVVTEHSNVDIIASLPQDHLFGQSFSNGQVPITNLQLLVTGIVKTSTEDSNLSKAYISIAGQQSKIYSVGDKLPYGVKVYNITRDAVILENDGRLEKLPLPRDHLTFKTRKERV